MEQDYLNLSEEENEQVNVEVKRNRKFDFYIAIFVLQGVICVSVLLFCIITKTFFGDFFER